MKRDTLVGKAAAAIRRHGLARPGDHILVAVSGGADSVALLLTLDALVPEWNFRLRVAHLDHGLRGSDAGRDRRFVTRLAERLGYRCVSRRVLVDARSNVEARARAIRYEFLSRVARKHGCERVAVGHNRNDQAETVLLRLLRGAGTRGLGAMAPRRGRIIRPLLDCTREEILSFLRENGVEWVEDATNQDRRFTRNRIRHALIPILAAQASGDVLAGLARTAELLRGDDRLLERVARRRLSERLGTEGRLDTKGLSEMPVALQTRVLRSWLRVVRSSLRGIGRGHIEALQRGLTGSASSVVMLPGGLVTIEVGALRWLVAPPPIIEAFCVPVEPGMAVSRPDLGWEVSLGRPVPWHDGGPLPKDKWTAVFDGRLLPPGLVVRSVEAGDRVRPIGLRGTQKLQDVFTNSKVPRSARGALPIVASGRDVLWVPGLSRSEIATVSDRTTSVVRASWRRLP